MTGRHPATRIHNQARTLADIQLRKEHRGEYSLLFYAASHELADTRVKGEAGAKRFNDRVRAAATRELRQLYPSRVRALEEQFKRDLRVAAGMPAEGTYRYVNGRRVSRNADVD